MTWWWKKYRVGRFFFFLIVCILSQNFLILSQRYVHSLAKLVFSCKYICFPLQHFCSLAKTFVPLLNFCVLSQRYFHSLTKLLHYLTKVIAFHSQRFLLSLAKIFAFPCKSFARERKYLCVHSQKVNININSVIINNSNY